MTDTEELMLRALAEHLGPQKLAELQRTPLHTLVRQKVANEHGISLDPHMPLEDAVAALAIGWRTKKATHAKIKSGLHTLRAVLRGKSASASARPSVYAPGTSVAHKVAAARKLRVLQSQATTLHDAAKLGSERRRVNRDIVDGLLRRARTGAKHASTLGTVGKGLAFGAGTAVPLYLAGSHLADKKMDDAQNRVVNTALGGAALGTALYGGKALIDRLTVQRSSEKQASCKVAEDAVSEIEALIGQVPPEELLEMLYAADLRRGEGGEDEGDVYDTDERIVRLLEESLLS